MHPQESQTPRVTRVVLDCGSDEARLDEGDLEMLGNAVELVIPWQFTQGTCIQLTLKRTGSGRVFHAETMVAESRPCPCRAGRFLTTLLVLRAEPVTQDPKESSQVPLPGEEAIALCALL